MRNFKPWTKLIEDYATEFFSDAILCIMGESIENLELREKHAMGKDVFKARTEEDDTKKKADEKKKKADENNKY